MLPLKGSSFLSTVRRFRSLKTVCILVIERVGCKLFIFSKMALDGLSPEGSLNFLKTVIGRPISDPRSIQFFTFLWSSSLKQTVHNVSGCKFQRSVKVISSIKRIKNPSVFRKNNELFLGFGTKVGLSMNCFGVDHLHLITYQRDHCLCPLLCQCHK